MVEHQPHGNSAPPPEPEPHPPVLQPDAEHTKDHFVHLSFRADWARRGPFERAIAYGTFVAILLTVAPTVDVIWHDHGAALNALMVENVILILVLCAQVGILHRDKHIIANRVELHAANLIHENRRLAEEHTAYRARTDRLVETIAQEFHLVSHRKRDIMNSSSYVPRELSPDNTVKVLMDFCAGITTCFEALFPGITFHAAIKATCTGDPAPSVMTVARDRIMASTDSFLSAIRDRIIC
jgi:hypothetical protein